MEVNLYCIVTSTAQQPDTYTPTAEQRDSPTVEQPETLIEEQHNISTMEQPETLNVEQPETFTEEERETGFILILVPLSPPLSPTFFLSHCHSYTTSTPLSSSTYMLSVFA